MYKITAELQDNHLCVLLSSNDQKIKRWKGPFAQLIIKEIINKISDMNGGFSLCHGHLQNFLHEITKLYQMVLFFYKVDKDLIESKAYKNRNPIAESILLHIRMSELHLRQTELFAYFVDDFPNENFLKFYETLETLQETQLIQAIEVNNKTIFYDKNPEDHQHIYEKKQ